VSRTSGSPQGQGIWLEGVRIIAAHSPVIMAVRGAQVFVLGDGPVAETSYEQTSHYRLYRDFMADPGRFV